MQETLDAQNELPIPAPRGKRILNQVVDLLGFYAFLTLILMALGVTAPNFMERWKADPSFALATNMVIFFLYYVGWEALSLRSPGKMLTGTMVVSYDGGIPGFSQIALRTLLRHLPLEWLPLFISDGQGGRGLPLHDRWSRTVVVEAAKRSE